MKDPIKGIDAKGGSKSAVFFIVQIQIICYYLIIIRHFNDMLLMIRRG